MVTEEEDPRDRVWRLLMEKERYTDCPREVMGALDALGVTNDERAGVWAQRVGRKPGGRCSGSTSPSVSF